MTDMLTLLGEAKALLLDFDGPVAALMPPPINAEAADHAREALADVTLPAEVAKTSDHLAVLGYAIRNHPRLAAAVERACTAVEREAALHCTPNINARILLLYAEHNEIPVAMVSNNADAAVRTFFKAHAWTDLVNSFSCRTKDTMHLLKPDPFLLLAAASDLQVVQDECVFIGDSASDVEAGRQAGMPVIGLAKHEGRAGQLREAGAADVFPLRAPLRLDP